MAKKVERRKNDYKVIISELGADPFRVVNIIFALTCVIPMLVLFYIIIGNSFLYTLLLGSNGLQAAVAIIIAFTGLMYAYNLVKDLVEKLLVYSEERRLADEEKSEFIVSVSRDLKTPAQVLKSEIGNISPGIGGLVEGAIARLFDLIEKIANFPEAASIRANVRREFIDFKDVVGAEVNDAQDMVKQKEISIQYAAGTDNASIWGDGKKLSKAVIELLSGMIKLTPGGGTINVTVSSDPSTVRLSISNIPAEKVPEKAQAVSKSGPGEDASRAAGDPEAGLSIIKDVIDLHKGHISVYRHGDKEAEFKVVLPRDLRSRLGTIRNRSTVPDAEILAKNEEMWLAMNDILRDVVAKTKTPPK